MFLYEHNYLDEYMENISKFANDTQIGRNENDEGTVIKTLKTYYSDDGINIRQNILSY